MKRLIIFFAIFLIFFMMFSQYKTKEIESKDHSYEVIPDEAIRLRILSHSDQEDDQDLKHLIRDRVNEQITEWLDEFSSLKEARKTIQEKLPEIEKTVQHILKLEKVSYDAQVQYGKNISFPLKMYDSMIYPPGEYEAILITLGEGQGSNWWCVLFPPLCFLDFSNSTFIAEEEEEQKESEKKEPLQTKFFLLEWLGWS